MRDTLAPLRLFAILTLTACGCGKPPPAAPLDAGGQIDKSEETQKDADARLGLQVYPLEHDFGELKPDQAGQPATFTVSAPGVELKDDLIVLVKTEETQYLASAGCGHPWLGPNDPTCTFELWPTSRTPRGTHKIVVEPFDRPDLRSEFTVKLERPATKEPSLGLLGYWTFDGHLRDSSTNQNHGSFRTGRLQPTAIEAEATFVPGKHGLGIKFSNPLIDDESFPTEFVEIPSSVSLKDIGHLQMFSLTMWLRIDGEAVIAGERDKAWHYAVSQQQEASTSHDLFGAGLLGGRAMGVEHLFPVVAEDKFPQGTFHHVALTSDWQFLVLYVDGAERRRAERSFPFYVSKTNLIVGARQSISTIKHGWKGVIDEVKLYASVLSPEQVLADMNR